MRFHYKILRCAMLPVLGVMLMASLVIVPAEARGRTTGEDILKEQVLRKLYMDGMKAYRYGEYHIAEAAFRQVAKLEPDFRETRRFLQRIKQMKAINRQMETVDTLEYVGPSYLRADSPLSPPGLRVYDENGYREDEDAHRQRVDEAKQRVLDERTMIAKVKEDMWKETEARFQEVVRLYNDNLYMLGGDKAQELRRLLDSDLVDPEYRRQITRRLDAIEEETWQRVDRLTKEKRMTLATQADRYAALFRREEEYQQDLTERGIQHDKLESRVDENIEALYQDALDRMASGSYLTAWDILREIQRASPDYRSTKEYLDMIERRWGAPPQASAGGYGEMSEGDVL